MQINKLQKIITTLVIASLCALCFAITAFADQNTGTVTINDLSDTITATMVGGTNQINTPVTGQPGPPHFISSSFAIDGLVTGGTGYSVLKDRNGVSDVLQVVLTPRKRGGNTDYFDASWTFTSAEDPNSLDIGTMYGLAGNVVDAIIAAGQFETGAQQTMTGNMLDSNGNAFGVGGLTITAASTVLPEPDTMTLIAAALVSVTVIGVRRGKHYRR